MEKVIMSSSLSLKVKNTFSILVFPAILTLITACGGGETPDSRGGGGGDTNNSTDTSAPLSVAEISNANYQLSVADVGEVIYIDRNFIYTSVPDNLTNATILQTANDDKASTGDTFLTFSVNQDVTVFVAYDSSTPSTPAWLNTWTNTGVALNGDVISFNLYSKFFPAGSITLGGNEGPSNSMYTVAIVPVNGTGGTDGGTGSGGTGGDTGGGTGGDTGGGTGGDTGGDGTGGDTGSGGTESPNAADDVVSTGQNVSVTIDVINNDSGLADAPIVTDIFSNATNGSVAVQNDGTILYTPNNGFAGTDTFVYRITDNDGDIATANVTVDVTCPNCAANTTVTLSWSPNSDVVSGYEIYYAQSSVAADATTLLDTVSLFESGFNASAPSLDFDAWNELGLNKGDPICFRLKAYNSAGTSGFSTGICGTIPI